MNTSNSVVEVREIKALPDEIFGLIKEWVLPVKPRVCIVCREEKEVHLIKTMSNNNLSLKREYYCSKCWCFQLKWLTSNYSLNSAESYFCKEINNHLYPTESESVEETEKRRKKVKGEWNAIINNKYLFKEHKQRKTREKVAFYEGVINKCIKKRVNLMVDSINHRKDSLLEPHRKELLVRTLSKMLGQRQVSYDYFTKMMQFLTNRYITESIMKTTLFNFGEISSITKLNYRTKDHKWSTDSKQGPRRFNYEAYKKEGRVEFCGYWNFTTNKLEYQI